MIDRGKERTRTKTRARGKKVGKLVLPDRGTKPQGNLNVSHPSHPGFLRTQKSLEQRAHVT